MKILFLSRRSPSTIEPVLARAEATCVHTDSIASAETSARTARPDLLLVEHTPDMPLTEVEALAERLRALHPRLATVVIGAASSAMRPSGWATFLGEHEAAGELARLIPLVSDEGPREPERVTGDVRIDLESRIVTRQGAHVDLTATEYALLELLARNPGRLYSRSEILDRIWPVAFHGDERIVDAYIKRLRKKVGEQSVETVRGLGYRMRTAEPGPVAVELGPRLATVVSEALAEARDPAAITEVLWRELTAAGLADGVHLALKDGTVLASAGTTSPLHRALVRRAVEKAGEEQIGLTFASAAGDRPAHATLLLTRRTDDPMTFLALTRASSTTWTESEEAFLELVAAITRSALLLWLERHARARGPRTGQRRDFLYDLDGALEHARRHESSVDVLLFELQAAHTEERAQTSTPDASPLGRYLPDLMREGDRVYRLEDGVFGVILPSTRGTGRPLAHATATQLQSLLDADRPGAYRIETASVRFPEHGRSLAELLRAGLGQLTRPGQGRAGSFSTVESLA